MSIAVLFVLRRFKCYTCPGHAMGIMIYPFYSIWTSKLNLRYGYLFQTVEITEIPKTIILCWMFEINTEIYNTMYKQ